MVEVARERGVANVTVADVVARSGVSRRTFYEQFEDREECFLAAFDEAIARITAVVVPAYEQAGSWRAKVRAALTALLEFLEYEPVTGHFVIVESLGAGVCALERRSRVLAQIIAVIEEGRGESKSGSGLPPLTAEGVVGGVLGILHSRLLTSPGPGMGALPAETSRVSLGDLVGPLMSMIVLPYLGASAARRELAVPAPASGRHGPVRNANPLKDLEMRLTYRTVRVLIAIGAQPGVSNRRVADAAEVTDQGQISKLLARLEHLGLIENTGFGQAKGESNSWQLTQHGQNIEHAIREQTTRR